jgi:hypothetical protein
VKKKPPPIRFHSKLKTKKETTKKPKDMITIPTPMTKKMSTKVMKAKVPIHLMKNRKMMKRVISKAKLAMKVRARLMKLFLNLKLNKLGKKNKPSWSLTITQNMFMRQCLSL